MTVKKKTPSIHQKQAALLRAMANPVRLQILRLLMGNGGAYVCHLALALGKRQPYISQQLSVLRRARLVIDERHGLNIFYRLNGQGIGEFLENLALLTPDARGESLDVLPDEPLAGCLCPHCAGRLGLDESQVCVPELSCKTELTESERQTWPA